MYFICISLSNLLATWDFLLLSFFLFLACWAWVQQLDLDAYPLFDVFMTPRLRRVLLNVEQATAARRTPRDLLSTDLPIAPFHPHPPTPHHPPPAPSPTSVHVVSYRPPFSHSSTASVSSFCWHGRRAIKHLCPEQSGVAVVCGCAACDGGSRSDAVGERCRVESLLIKSATGLPALWAKIAYSTPGMQLGTQSRCRPLLSSPPPPPLSLCLSLFPCFPPLLTLCPSFPCSLPFSFPPLSLSLSLSVSPLSLSLSSPISTSSSPHPPLSLSGEFLLVCLLFAGSHFVWTCPLGTEASRLEMASTGLAESQYNLQIDSTSQSTRIRASHFFPKLIRSPF